MKMRCISALLPLMFAAPFAQAKAVTTYTVSDIDAFRAAVSAKGERRIEFKATPQNSTPEMGIILKATDHKNINVHNGDLTIDGTSAGVPVTLYGASLYIEKADNVHLNNLHLRLGAQGFKKKSAREALVVEKSKDVSISHCSLSWGTDETVTFIGANNLRFNDNIVSEPLNHPKTDDGDDVHPEKHDHGYCLLIRGSKNVYVYRNVFAHCLKRVPTVSPDGREESRVMVSNNIVYNYGESGTKYNDGGKKKPRDRYSIEKNLYLEGLDKDGPAIQFDIPNEGGKLKAAVIDNYLADKPVKEEIRTKDNGGKIKVKDKYRIKLKDFEPVDARSLPDAILSSAGANLPYRDLIDARIIEDVKRGTGRFIDHEKDTPEFSYFKIVS